jgi:uncharacterized protein YbcV (DUF1398 family)
MNREEVAQAEAMSTRSVPLPQVVAKLAAAGVETYYTDLVQLQKVFHGVDGESLTHGLPLADAGGIAHEFSESEVRSALAAIQGRQIGYEEFLHRIMRAGCMGYVVFIRGRRVLYFGRDGGFHVEPFPPSEA